MNTGQIITAVVTLIVGLFGGGSLVAWRKDARQAPIDESAADKARIEVTGMIDLMARNAVEKAKEQLAQQETRHKEEIGRLTRRIEQLGAVMKESGLTVPPWAD